eukprot:5323541-Pyramimonas_sp.AAC.1
MCTRHPGYSRALRPPGPRSYCGSQRRRITPGPPKKQKNTHDAQDTQHAGSLAHMPKMAAESKTK